MWLVPVATTTALPVSSRPPVACSSQPVPSGVRYTYVIKAVDTAGNVSEGSAPVEETSR